MTSTGLLTSTSVMTSTSLAISTVRKSLMQNFVPQNVGVESITPQQCIDEHMTEFVNTLYDPNPQTLKIIPCVDGSYIRIMKIRNFRALRQTYCIHKEYHMVKPVLIKEQDMYILAIQGPYFFDGQYNDAAVVRNEFVRDGDRINEWFQEERC